MKFKVEEVEEREVEVKKPRGKNGRRATNYLISQVEGSGEDRSVQEIIALTEDDEFLNVHLKAFFSKDDAEYVVENATTGELFNLIMLIVTDVFESFSTPEMDAALKNLQGAPAATEE